MKSRRFFVLALAFAPVLSAQPAPAPLVLWYPVPEFAYDLATKPGEGVMLVAAK